MLNKPLGLFDIYINDGNYGELYPEKEEFSDQGIPFISASDFDGREFNYKNIKFITEGLHFGRLTKGHLKVGDVVIVVRGNGIGKVGYFKDEIGECNINAQLAFIRTNQDDLDSQYLYYLLSSETYLRTMKKFGSGSAQPQLPINRLKLVPISAPDLQTQRKIGQALSAIDKKIELNNRINAELEAMAKTLYDYWFVQFDFPDDSPQGQGKPYKTSGGKMVYNPTLKREIPDGWEDAPLSSITRVSNESINPADYPEKLFKHFSIPVFDATNTFGVERGDTIGSNKFTVKDTDLLVSKLNPWFNRVVYAMAEPEQICSTEFVVWRCPNASIKNFMYMIATSPQFIAHCTQSATGTSNSHKRVNPNVMMRFDQPFNLKVAEKLGQHLEPILKQLIVNQRENTKLASLRDWLLPMLMNGQVTVK